MKLLAIALILGSVTSCAPKYFYQVFKTQSDGSVTKNNALLFEDENCLISYNLWDEYGESGFSFYNKTNKDLSVDLANSFFILNNYAFPYYQGRTLSSTTTQAEPVKASSIFSVAKAQEQAEGKSTSYIERPVLIVPPHSLGQRF